MNKIVCFVVLVIIVQINGQYQNNVCNNYQDYNNISQSKNCWYNPDVNSTPEQIARNHGYNFESHRVKTEDNYYLTLFRIRSNYTDPTTSPVLFHHGIASSALCFMTAGKRSLAFFLADNGYDVWLANVRGNEYSVGHAIYNMSDPRYWNFTFHDSAIYDIPAYMEYITNLTKPKNKITYIGHSMGTTIAFIYSSLRREHSEKFMNGMVMLAPVASLKYYFSPLKRLFPVIGRLIEEMKNDNGLALFPGEVQRQMFRSLCARMPLLDLCSAVVSLILGPDDGELAPEDIPILLSYHPARTALKSLIHYFQIVTTARFQYFDYGVDGNMKMYNQTYPPKYRISNIRLPVYLYYGVNDYFSGANDASLIYKHLRTKQKSLNLIPNKEMKMKVNHLDFLYGKHLTQYLGKPVLDNIRTMQNTNKIP